MALLQNCLNAISEGGCIAIVPDSPCYGRGDYDQETALCPMSPRKLTADDKVAIVELYREVGQTTSTVAEEYGVSISTISRLLKSELSSEDYDALVRQKRAGGKESRKLSEKSKGSVRAQRTVKKGGRKATVKKGSTAAKRPGTVKKSRSSEASVSDEPEPEVQELSEAEPQSNPKIEQPEAINPSEREMSSESDNSSDSAPLTQPDLLPEQSNSATEALEPVARKPKKPAPIRRRRRRSSPDPVQLDIPVVDSSVQEVAEATADESVDVSLSEDDEVFTESNRAEAVEVTAEEASLKEVLSEEDLVKVEDEFSDAFDEDEPDEEDEDEDDAASDAFIPSQGFKDEAVEILPIEDADLARMLYLIVDRMAELITCPMQEFQDLGQVPSDEENLQTLPIFDNHRIARRFSKRNQRVIKVPDGRLLVKTAPWLEAKGITRCLLDGQVYSLETR